jgi:DNA-binding MarR family transcriptional regulator
VDDLEQEIYNLLSQSFIRLDTSDQHLMRRFGLTLTQSWALVHLGDPEGHSLSNLADLLICDKSNVTSVVDKLEEEGLAERKRGKAGDRRYTRVVLTEQGHALRRTIMAAREQMVRERFRDMSQHDQRQLHTLLQQMAHNLTTQYEQNEESKIIDDAYERSTASLSRTETQAVTQPSV